MFKPSQEEASFALPRPREVGQAVSSDLGLYILHAGLPANINFIRLIRL